MTNKIDIDALVPGGIRATDKLHHITNDGTCSRCGKDTEDEVPLMLWIGQGDDLLIYCQACLNGKTPAAPVVGGREVR